jgi:MPBQ/MSBQ methyltransferase
MARSLADSGATPAISQNYDLKMHDPLIRRFYGGSDFFNFGYWHPDTQCAREACENLMEELLAYVPRKTGCILDVACGLGATTRHLTRHYDPARVFGVNISPQQIETCRVNAPECKFAVMDAVNLAFRDSSFDAVICVEAAFHFRTRENFLREARRILCPGGCLILSDMMLSRWCEVRSPVFFIENHIESEDEYVAVLEAIGFGQVLVRGVMAETWIGYITHLTRFLREKLIRGEIGRAPFNQIMLTIRTVRIPAVRGYLLVGARKLT